jgi:hypothetical protein
MLQNKTHRTYTVVFGNLSKRPIAPFAEDILLTAMTYE